MGSLALLCLDLDIQNIEYEQIQQLMISNISVQEWVNFDIKKFVEHEKILSNYEKKILASHLKRCKESLRL